MKLEFAKLSPTRNMTLIVTSPVARDMQPAVAEKLMAYGSVGAEQVGFLEPASLPGARARLQMMGGEFCGNAAMSLATFFAYQDDLPEGAETVYPLEISGAGARVDCRIVRGASACTGSVNMPLPERIEKCELEPFFRLPVVFFPGIAHVIVHEDMLSAEQAEKKIRSWCRAAGAEAFGILRTSAANDRISPLVYVRETDSAVWEHGCGSGTAALGAYCAMRAGQDQALEVSQPGGTIRVRAAYEAGRVSSIEISGEVKLVAAGSAWID